MKFLIQELKTDRGASRFYLRLEKNGVFEGWIIPKGLPAKKGAKRLAIEVGPLPLKAERFEGRIKKSRFGAGKLFIRDRGEIRSRCESDKEIIVDLSGSRFRGKYTLGRYTKKGPDAWIISRTNKSTPPRRKKANKNEKKPSRQPQKRQPARSKKTRISPKSQTKTTKKIQPAPPPKKRSSRQKYRKWKSQNRPKARLTSRFPQKMKTREGRLIGWIYMGIIILIIYGFIQLIRYIGTII